MINPNKLIDGLAEYDETLDHDLVYRAYMFAIGQHGCQLRDSGEPFFSHPIEVASILLDLKMDHKTIVAALLHDIVEDTDVTGEEIGIRFGKDISRIVDGVTKLSEYESSLEIDKRTENFKKLLLSSSTDIRVLIIKLADRLHNMRTIRYKRLEKRHLVSKETMEIYAPLAERIGILQLKEELQDISFSNLHPDVHEFISNKLKETYSSSAPIISEIVKKLEDLMKSEGLDCSISGRAKRPYSIWKKMNKGELSLGQLSDIIAFRIVVNSNLDCYKALGRVHNTYPAIPGKLKDYISTPKSNNYQSLHTCIIGPLGKQIEVQIRTKEMHEIAEYGIAAHWTYKQETDGLSPKERGAYKWLRGVVESLDETGTLNVMEEAEIFDQVFVATPRGKLVALPKGASALDFSYAIHSEIGNHTFGVRINGKDSPMKTQLKNGDEVDIITNLHVFPKNSWLEYVVTPKAKTYIKKSLSSADEDRRYVIGKTTLDKELRKRSIKLTNEITEELLKMFGYKTKTQLYIDVGNAITTADKIIEGYYVITKENTAGKAIKNTVVSSMERELNDVILPISLEHAVIKNTNCCFPVPGDKILAVINAGSTIEIHTEQCQKLNKTVLDSNTKVAHISWAREAEDFRKLFGTKIAVTSKRVPGLLSNMEKTIRENGGNLLNIKADEKFEGFVILDIELEVSDVVHLSTIIAAIRCNDKVTKVVRI